MESVVGRVVDLINELSEIAQEHKLFINVNARGQHTVQVIEAKLFFNKFNNFDINDFPSKEHPYQTFIEIEGVLFTALLTQADYEKFILKSA